MGDGFICHVVLVASAGAVRWRGPSLCTKLSIENVIPELGIPVTADAELYGKFKLKLLLILQLQCSGLSSI